MKKNVIIFILVCVCAYLIFKPSIYKKNEKVDPQSKQLVDTEVKRVNKKIDDKGFEHAVFEEIENTINNPSSISDSVKKELDSVNSLLGIKDRQLKQWINYSVSLRDSLLAAERAGDTSFTYRDKWTDIKYVPAKDSTSDGYFDFKYNAEINYAEYWDRSWFLGKKKHYIDFWISDKRATVNGVKRVKFEAKQDRSRIIVNALGMYHNGLHAGVDGQIRLGGRYWIGGGYLYDFESDTWRPLFTGRISLIDF